jgi:hypothetical protein
MTLRVIPPAQGLDQRKRALNIVVLSEGFLPDRENVFFAQVENFNRVLRASSPFHHFPSLVAVWALFVSSTASLANIEDATRCDWRRDASGKISNDPKKDDEPSKIATAFGALYCRARDSKRQVIERTLRGDPARVKAAIDGQPELAGLDVAALVLVDNVKAYGGEAKDEIGWFSMVKGWEQTAIHELGHSAFLLADEYDYDGPSRFNSSEPAEPNITVRANRDALRAFWNTGPSKFSLFRWYELMDPNTPTPTSVPNPTCAPLASTSAQAAKPGVAPDTVGLFEGAKNSPCDIFRPRLDCRMRHSVKAFCPVCEWAIGNRLVRTSDPLRVDNRVTVPGAWTLLSFYHEEPSRAPLKSDLGRFVFYAGTTGDYEVREARAVLEPLPPALSAPGAQIDPLWTSLSTCEIAGLPHFLAHSLPLGRLALYEVVSDAGKPRLDLRFDSGNNAAPWTHVTTFTSGGEPHMIGYNSGTGHIEISKLTANDVAPVVISGTALDPKNLWLPGYTLISTFTIDSVPHVLRHNAVDGVVHVQSLDPPGTGPNTFMSKPGHWNPGATAAIGYETDGRTFIHRTSFMNYEALDWVWPDGAGVETRMRRQSLDITLALARFRGKTASGFTPFGFDQIFALDVVGGRVRRMSVG